MSSLYSIINVWNTGKIFLPALRWIWRMTAKVPQDDTFIHFLYSSGEGAPFISDCANTSYLQNIWEGQILCICLRAKLQYLEHAQNLEMEKILFWYPELKLECMNFNHGRTEAELQSVCFSTAHAIHVIPSLLLLQEGFASCSRVFITIFSLNISTVLYTCSYGSTIKTAAFGIIIL